MKNILLFPLLLVSLVSFSQHALNNNGVVTTYETRAEYEAAVAAISQNDPVKLARRLLMDKENVLCREVLDDLRDAFKKEVEDGNMTITQATTLFTVVRDTFLSLQCGWLRESRMIANNTATTAIFTTARKNFLLAQIDAAIARLP
jgi:hypothetical protein